MVSARARHISGGATRWPLRRTSHGGGSKMPRHSRTRSAMRSDNSRSVRSSSSSPHPPPHLLILCSTSFDWIAISWISLLILLLDLVVVELNSMATELELAGCHHHVESWPLGSTLLCPWLHSPPLSPPPSPLPRTTRTKHES